MKIIKTILATIFFLSFQNIFSQETDTVKVTNIRKGVQAIVGNETIIPKVDEELPVNAKIQCDKMGSLEFEYKGKEYRIHKNTNILLADVIKSGGNDKFQPALKTDAGGARGLDKAKKKNKKQKPKKKTEEDK